MEAQQIRLDITELVNGIQDEVVLKACYEAVAGISKGYRRVTRHSSGAKARTKLSQRKPKITAKLLNGAPPTAMTETSLPHDLSLVALGNEMFKGSEPLPEEAELAFKRAFQKSLKTEPTLPNRI